MPPPLVQGRIVYGKILDPQGRNAKENRPLIVISKNPIDSTKPVWVDGVTSELTASPPDHYVAIPWGRDSPTKLSLESAALCTWVATVNIADVQVSSRWVPPRRMVPIIERLTELFNQGLIPFDPNL